MLILSEDEQLLATSAAEVVAGQAPVSRVRALRDRGEVFDRELWDALVELGWPAIPFAEDDGGLGLGLPGLAVVLEVLGRNAVATPLASTAMAAVLDPSFGCQEGRVLAVAWRESPRDDRADAVQTTAVDGRLTGRKLVVDDATAADAFVVSARTGDRIALWRVRADAVRVEPRRQVDHRDVADVHLDGAPGEPLDGGVGLLEEALDAGRVAEAAEALGHGRGVFARTLAYAHERVQFGRPIGSFQALQHRMVDVFVQLELAQSAVMQAARHPSRRWVALAQAKTAQALWLAATEAVQLHGGIGMTDESDVGFFVKRAMVVARRADGAAARFSSSA